MGILKKFDWALHPEQSEALVGILQFVNNGNRRYRAMRLRARAGTGKTYTARCAIQALQHMGYNCAVCVFTGRGSKQIGKDGIEATTIHKLIYNVVLDREGNLVGFEKKNLTDFADIDAIFLDEAGMVNRTLYNELKTIGVPIVNMGDDRQLESIPPEDNRDDVFNLMGDDHEETYTQDIALTVNHRTDPEMRGIVKIMDVLAERNSIPRIGGGGLKYSRKNAVMSPNYHIDNQFEIILCGTNRMRQELNAAVRHARGYDCIRPEVGERIMALKNDRTPTCDVTNGSIYEVTGRVDIDSDYATYYITDIDDGSSAIVTVRDESFESEIAPKNIRDRTPHFSHFTYGYASSVSKAQGSTFESVLFVDEDVSYFSNQQKFRYTGVSRASKRLVVAI